MVYPSETGSTSVSTVPTMASTNASRSSIHMEQCMVNERNSCNVLASESIHRPARLQFQPKPRRGILNACGKSSEVTCAGKKPDTRESSQRLKCGLISYASSFLTKNPTQYSHRRNTMSVTPFKVSNSEAQYRPVNNMPVFARASH